MQRFPSQLLKGYNNFMNGRFSEQQQRYKALAETGQQPKNARHCLLRQPRGAGNHLR